MDRRTFVLGTAAAAVSASRLFAWRAAAVELGSVDGSVGGNQFTPTQVLDYFSSIKLTWAMISLPAAIVGDEAAIRQIREHADRLGIKLQLAHGSLCPSSRSFNAQLGTIEEQVSRALKASQIFGANCMRCILGGDSERPQIEMHIDNMVKAVSSVRSRIVDSGVKLAVENHGGDLQAREMKMMIDTVGRDVMGVCLDSGNPVWMLEDPHMTLEMLIPYAETIPRARQRRLEGAGGHCREVGEHGRGKRRHRRLDIEVHSGQAGASSHLREPRVRQSANSQDLRPKILGQLASDARLGTQSLPGRGREGHAEACNAAAAGKTAGQQRIEDLETCVRYTRDLLRRL